MNNLRILVTGACGKMGREVIKAVTSAPNMQVVAAVDMAQLGEDIGQCCGIGALGVPICNDLISAIRESAAQVCVDFTRPDVIMANLRITLPMGVASVVGTTGLTSENIAELRELSEAYNAPLFIAPNFAIGAVLMMQFAQQAAKYFDYAEVIEFHHEKKLDSPSGTALRSAELISNAAANRLAEKAASESGEESRGIALGNVRVHAVRLPGVVANQEIIFGGLGQTLTIRHDTINRESFMPGVLMAINKVLDLQGVVIGLEEIM